MRYVFSSIPILCSSFLLIVFSDRVLDLDLELACNPHVPERMMPFETVLVRLLPDSQKGRKKLIMYLQRCKEKLRNPTKTWESLSFVRINFKHLNARSGSKSSIKIMFSTFEFWFNDQVVHTGIFRIVGNEMKDIAELLIILGDIAVGRSSKQIEQHLRTIASKICSISKLKDFLWFMEKFQNFWTFFIRSEVSEGY